MLIRRGKRVADYLRGDCLAVYVLPDLRWNKIASSARVDVERHLNFARNLRIDTQVIDGRSIAPALVDFARKRRVTQIYMGRTKSAGRMHVMRTGTVHKVATLARDMQVVIVSERKR